MPTVLVFGAAGSLGKRLLEHSFRRGDRVVALTRPESVSKLDDSKQSSRTCGSPNGQKAGH